MTKYRISTVDADTDGWDMVAEVGQWELRDWIRYLVVAGWDRMRIHVLRIDPPHDQKHEPFALKRGTMAHFGRGPRARQAVNRVWEEAFIQYRLRKPEKTPRNVIEAAIRVVDKYNKYLSDDSSMYPDSVEPAIHDLADALTREGYVGKEKALFWSDPPEYEED